MMHPEHGERYRLHWKMCIITGLLPALNTQPTILDPRIGEYRQIRHATLMRQYSIHRNRKKKMLWGKQASTGGLSLFDWNSSFTGAAKR